MGFTYEFVVPALGDGPAQATVARWLVDELDPVERGSRVVTLRIGGTDFDVIAEGRAIVLQRFVVKGAQVARGDVLARLGAEGEDIPYGRPYSSLVPSRP